MSRRYAVVRCSGKDKVKQVQNYLPSNYKATHSIGDEVFIEGEDSCGWTLDGYVLPRLASGMMGGEEIVARSVEGEE